MKQKFFTNTIQSNFIKNILYNTPLPIFNTVRLGDYVLKDKFYVFKNDIIKCTKTGYYGAEEGQEACEYIRIGNYNFGDEIPKFTDTFHSLYAFYDSETHERLGKYLRCYRDIYDIDLMPFYNCFSGRYQESLTITEDGVFSLMKSTSYKTFKVPIQFNKKYTIAIDSSSEVFIAPVFMRDNDLLYVNDANDTEQDLTNLITKGRLKRYNSTSFKTPVTYEVNIIGDENQVLFDKYEKNLYILIQVSVLNTSSLVVLEGDYKYINTERVFNVNEIESISEQTLNELMLSDLSLLQFNDEVRYPFSNRIIEYLLLNVITNNDEISSNITRVQEYLGFDTMSNYYKGVFTNDLRKFIYDYVMSNRLTWKLDINGFVDKEAEKLILRGKDV